MATFGTFTAGQILTAAELNAAGTWTSFTPSWSQLTPGNGTVAAAYSVFNKILFCNVSFTLGSTSSVGDPVRMTVPGSLTLNTTRQSVIGHALFEDTGVATYAGVIQIVNGTTIGLLTTNVAGTYPTLTTLTGTRPFSSFSGDKFTFSFVAEIA